MRAAVLAGWLALAAGAAMAQPAQLELPPPVLTFDAERLLAESGLARALTAQRSRRRRAGLPRRTGGSRRSSWPRNAP
jgi:hypothetical protein